MRSLALVPADTPYVFAALDGAHAEAWEPSLRDIHDSLATIEQSDAGARSQVVRQLRAEMRDGSRIRSAAELGFAAKAKFVLYGVSLWPVLRIEIADAVKVRDVAARVLAHGGPDVREGSRGGARYWAATFEKVTIVAAVLERELVLAVVPTAGLERTLGLVIGTQRPERSLADARTLDREARKHGFLRDWLGYIDSRRALELLAGGGSVLERELGALWREDAAALTACRRDLARIARAIPRLVVGYSRLDGRGIDGALVLEAPAIGGALQAMRTEIPDLVVTRRPLFTIGIGVDSAQLVEWLRTSGAALRDQLTCPALAGLGGAGGELSDALASIPPMYLGMRAFSMVVDDVTVSPPMGTGAAVLVGDSLPMLVGLAWRSVPQLANVPTPTLGIPVALPLRQLGIDQVTSAHVAVGSDRLALAAGSDSEVRVRHALAAGPEKRTALVSVMVDLARAATLGLLDDVKPEDRRNIDRLETAGFALDADERGIAIRFTGTLKPKARR